MRPASSFLRVNALFALLGVAEAAIVPFVPLLLRNRGMDAQGLGAVLALMSAVAFTAGPLWGLLADRLLGYERTLMLSLFATTGAALVFAVTHRVAAIAVAGSLLWATRSAIASMADSMALARLGPERRGGYGGIRLWLSAGFAIGAMVFGALVETVGLHLVAPLYAGLCALNATGFALVLRGRPRRSRVPAVHGPRAPLTALPALAVFLLALLLASAAYSASYSFIAIRIAALGGGALFVGVSAGLQAAAEVPSMAWTRRAARRLRPSTVFAAGAAAYAVVYVAWALVDAPAAVAAIRLLAGVGFGLTSVGTVLLIDEVVPVRLRATGQAASKAVAFGLAPVAGSLGGGLVYGYLGPTTFFVACTGLTLAAAAVTQLLGRSRPPVEQTKLEHA